MIKSGLRPTAQLRIATVLLRKTDRRDAPFAIPFLAGVLLGIRYLIYLYINPQTGHIQSLILAAILLLTGVQTFVVGLHADLIAANRKMLEEVKYHIKKMEYDEEKESCFRNIS